MGSQQPRSLRAQSVASIHTLTHWFTDFDAHGSRFPDPTGWSLSLSVCRAVNANLTRAVASMVVLFVSMGVEMEAMVCCFSFTHCSWLVALRALVSTDLHDEDHVLTWRLEGLLRLCISQLQQTLQLIGLPLPLLLLLFQVKVLLQDLCADGVQQP